MLRKRPPPLPPSATTSQAAGKGSNRHPHKKQKLAALTPAPIPADAYAQLAKAPPLPVGSTFRPSPAGRREGQGVRAVPSSSSSSSSPPASSRVREDGQTESPPGGVDEEEVGSEEGSGSVQLVAASASRVSSSPSSSPSPSPVPSTGRPPPGTLPLQHLRFLLSSSHSLALVSPSISQHLVRLLRALSAQFAVELHEDVRSRFCLHCSALLLPGFNCTRVTTVDEQRMKRWRQKQQKRSAKRAKHRARSQSALSSNVDSVIGQHESSEAVDSAQQQQQQQPTAVTRRLRLSSAQRKAAEKARLRAQREATIRPVRFFHTIVVCGQCGQANEVEGSQVRKGGRHCPDVRSLIAGGSGAQRQRKGRPRAAQKMQPLVEESKPEVEEKKAARRRQQLQRQQQGLAKAAGKPAAARVGADAGPPSSDAFSGSLFFRFQRPGKQGLLSEAAAIASNSAVASSGAAAAQPFSFQHPAAKPAAPFIHTRAGVTAAQPTASLATQPLTLLEAAAKKRREEDKARKRQHRVAEFSSSSSASTSAPSLALPAAPTSAGGLYSLLQSFNR